MVDQAKIRDPAPRLDQMAGGKNWVGELLVAQNERNAGAGGDQQNDCR